MSENSKNILKLWNSFSYIHPAYTSFDELYSNLLQEVNKGNIRLYSQGDLEGFDYTIQCSFENNWNIYTLMSRGLILSPKEKRVVCFCMPKFFNASELEYDLPNLSFSTKQKVDGSCIMIYYYDNKWNCSTRGSFSSDQAIWANKYLYDKVDVNKLDKNTNYICEAIYKANRIVAEYDWEGLVLLTAYKNGIEQEYKSIPQINGLRYLGEQSFSSIDDIVNICKTLSYNEEGFVVRFSNGFRVKIKSNEYMKVHKLKSTLSPLSVWESLRDCISIEESIKNLPDEFFDVYRNLKKIFEDKLEAVISEIKYLYEQTKDMTAKDLGLSNIKYKSFIFSCRNNDFLNEVYKPSRVRISVFEIFRPTGNVI